MDDDDGELQAAIAASLEDSNKARQVEEAPSATTLATMTAQEQDRLTVEQMNEIVAGIASSQPMVGDRLKLGEALLPEYADNPSKGFARGIGVLEGKYSAMRRVRKDGNCFYRAFLYRYVEQLCVDHAAGPGSKVLEAPEGSELERVQKVIKSSKEKLLSVGYEDSAIDMFWDMLVEVLDEVPKTTADSWHSKMNDEHGVSMHIVWFCRALSATQIKLQPERFEPFIMDDTGVADVHAFCRTEVEPVNMECEQVQIIALTEMLGVPVCIEYLDGSGAPTCIVFPEGSKPCVTLLYRPGHYDILYE
ncbi:peptidase C65 Otubain-domain-containing protein [Pelagophyceae sp. CCMP2097]|nr:peptidase C65 Otubain-domain-containing protein [Pelagophyceae sp. CCMP2097]